MNPSQATDPADALVTVDGVKVTASGWVDGVHVRFFA
jgi:hypothetical protein